MSTLAAICRELLGLFVDDGSLALSILAIVGLAAVLAFGFTVPTALIGAELVLGCLIALIASTLRAARS